MKKELTESEKIDELMAHVFYIEAILNRFLGIDLDQASESVENLRKTVKNLKDFIPKED